MTKHVRPDLDAALRAVEATLRSGGEPSAHQLGALRDLAAAQPQRARALAGRLDHVFSTSALRGREVPEGALDGLFEDVRTAVQDDRFGRARMSTAFLEAPTSLVAWRRVAVAATVLLAFGVVWASMGEPAGEADRSEPLAPDEDPRYRVLDTLPAVGSGSAMPASVRDLTPTNRARTRGGRLEYIEVPFDETWVSDPGASRPIKERAGASGR